METAVRAALALEEARAEAAARACTARHERTQAALVYSREAERDARRLERQRARMHRAPLGEQTYGPIANSTMGGTIPVEPPAETVDEEEIMGTERLLVTVPNGVLPGESFQVQGSWGGLFDVQCPEGITPGEAMEIDLPLDGSCDDAVPEGQVSPPPRLQHASGGAKAGGGGHARRSLFGYEVPCDVHRAEPLLSSSTLLFSTHLLPPSPLTRRRIRRQR